ncbi:MAG: hypothetical protein C4520_06560 [Candidatus Abyssobacteria bacterium SURF_5]|uniref:Uncharacterized protein n=1 Tax=Abyssobacteria bacterium (strain SURF_5) TaxID=2093360 RepID=A0A3A4NXJ6_ABYX5|nr:MAG: hypothetical protein C4520_06560 [Candidatus Abyssubacteria bacterium SURF_5]
MKAPGKINPSARQNMIWSVSHSKRGNMHAMSAVRGSSFLRHLTSKTCDCFRNKLPFFRLGKDIWDVHFRLPIDRFPP